MMRPTNTRNNSVTASYPWPVLASQRSREAGCRRHPRRSLACADELLNPGVPEGLYLPILVLCCAYKIDRASVHGLLSENAAQDKLNLLVDNNVREGGGILRMV